MCPKWTSEKTGQAGAGENATLPGQEKIAPGKLLLKKFQSPHEDSLALTT
jgi:hypothetical protein